MAAFSILSLSSSAEKNYYRWLDERGSPVHSDRPPPKGIDYEVVSTGSTLTRPVEAEEGAVPAEIEPTAGNEFEQADSEKNQRVKKNPEYCQRAKDNLATLSRAARVRIRNDQGEYHYLDAEEKEAQRQDAEAGISTYCE
jgi:hypothetical protein